MNGQPPVAKMAAQLTSADAQKLMEAAMRMKRENQTHHPKYAQIITLLRQFQQQQLQQRMANANANANASASAQANAATTGSANSMTTLQQQHQLMLQRQRQLAAQAQAQAQTLQPTPLAMPTSASLAVTANPFMQKKPDVRQPPAQQMAAMQTNAVVELLFTEKQLEHLHEQIRTYKQLCLAMDDASGSGLSKSRSSTPPPSSSTGSARTTPTKQAQSPSQPKQSLPVVLDIRDRKPRWTRASKDLVYLGPECFDGDLVDLESKTNAAFGGYNISSPWLGLNDVAMKMRYLRTLQQFLTSSLETLEAANVATLSDAEKETLHVLRCVLLQQRLRSHVSKAYTNRLALVGEPPVAIDRKSFRRRRPLSRLELQHDEKEKRKKSVALEKQRRAEHQQYLKTILNHSRDFFAYHKNVKAQVTKSARAAKAFVDAKATKAEREEDRQEKLRLKALKANDMEAYGKLVAEAKNERLTYLLSQTNSYLDSIRKLVRDHKRKHNVVSAEGKDAFIEEDEDEEKKSGDDEEDLNYLEVASKGELPRQPMMLVGGDLKEYQLRGLQWMVSLYDNHLNGILADEMGLGKTIQSISLLTYVFEIKHNHGPFLVVVPLSTLSNWVNEFKKWAPDLVVVIYKGAPQARKDIFKHEMASFQFNVLLTTYEYIMKDKHILRKYDWQYIIVDEGHRMKNAQSKFAMTLGTMYTSRNRLLLTGTPLQNSLPELWALLNFLLPTIFESVDTFEQWFSKPFAQFSGSGETNELSDEERMLIINRLHQVLRPFLLRRVKSSVLDQLPDKVERVLKCELSGWQKILYRRIQEGSALLLESGGDENGEAKGKTKYTSKGLSNVLMQLRKVCNHPYLFQTNGYPLDFDIVRTSGKFELLDRMLPKLQAAGHRVLMFSQMTQLMHVLEDYFNYRGFRYLRLDGSTSADEREQRMFMFNAPDSPFFIFLLSTRAGGLGLNLATADTVVIFDSDWNPAMDAQAQDRAHRIGQKNEVRVFRLVTNTPVEEKILARATDKMNMNNLVVEAGKFNNRSKEAERRAMLESLIKMESEEAANAANGEGEEGSTVLLDDEINEMMALTDEELVLYQRLDTERLKRENLEWAEHCKRMNTPYAPRTRLMNDKDVPEWLKEADTAAGVAAAARGPGDGSKRDPDWNFDLEPDGSRRKRKEVSYRDQYTDSEFVKMCEDGLDEEGEPVKKPAKIKKSATAPPAVLPLVATKTPVVSIKRRRESSSVTGGDDDGVGELAYDLPDDDESRRERKVLGYFHRKIYDGVVKLADSTGRLRCELFMEKPSAEDYPDYYDFIKQPMDLGTIKSRIDAHLYASHDHFESDVKLMVANAHTYNHPQSLVYHDANEMDKFVKSKLKRVRQKSMEQLTVEYEAARQQHKERSKARKDKKRPRHD
jgi:ATP-dependent helicase STH1/SNF2